MQHGNAIGLSHVSCDSSPDSVGKKQRVKALSLNTYRQHLFTILVTPTLANTKSSFWLLLLQAWSIATVGSILQLFSLLTNPLPAWQSYLSKRKRYVLLKAFSSASSPQWFYIPCIQKGSWILFGSRCFEIPTDADLDPLFLKCINNATHSEPSREMPYESCLGTFDDLKCHINI